MFRYRNRPPVLSNPTQAGCLEVLADLPRVLRAVVCKLAWNCTGKVTHAEGAASEKEDYAAENEVVRVSLYYLC